MSDESQTHDPAWIVPAKEDVPWDYERIAVNRLTVEANRQAILEFTPYYVEKLEAIADYLLKEGRAKKGSIFDKYAFFGNDYIRAGWTQPGNPDMRVVLGFHKPIGVLRGDKERIFLDSVSLYAPEANVEGMPIFHIYYIFDKNRNLSRVNVQLYPPDYSIEGLHDEAISRMLNNSPALMSFFISYPYVGNTRKRFAGFHFPKKAFKPIIGNITVSDSKREEVTFPMLLDSDTDMFVQSESARDSVPNIFYKGEKVSGRIDYTDKQEKLDSTKVRDMVEELLKLIPIDV